MRIDGIFLPDVPVLSAALSDDLVLVVQRSGLLVQSYQNLTSTYYAIAGEIKIPGINLPTVRIATSQPTDELLWETGMDPATAPDSNPPNRFAGWRT